MHRNLHANSYCAQFFMGELVHNITRFHHSQYKLHHKTTPACAMEQSVAENATFDNLPLVCSFSSQFPFYHVILVIQCKGQVEF